MKKLNQKNRILILLILLCIGIWVYWGNTALEINTYEIISHRLPSEFDGFRIAQISDFHNTELGRENSKLIQRLSETAPDLIVITGDMIDSRRTDLEVALSFAKEIIRIAPVYYVTGNHEARVGEYALLKKGLQDIDVIVLENQKAEIVREGECITLMGIQDPNFSGDVDGASIAKLAISQLQDSSDGYTVLLSHRPELFEVYADAGIDLVFSGHAHGGQFRIPFVGGLIAPHQGFFPMYDASLFHENNTSMLVSRGIGNSLCPIRINNRPEIIVAELHTSK